VFQEKSEAVGKDEIAMKDEEKTKEQLMAELEEMRQQNEELKKKHLGTDSGVLIGEILIDMGHLTRMQLERSLEEQEAEMISYMVDRKRRKIGEILIEAGLITEQQLSSALDEQRLRLDRQDEAPGPRKRRWWSRK
jgi:hypothetical protein